MPEAQFAVAVRPRRHSAVVFWWLAAGSILCAPLLPGQVPAGPVHEVGEGETLWGLAVRYLSGGERWREIYDLNRQEIADPDLIWPGQSIRLPLTAAVAAGASDNPAPLPAATAAPAPAAKPARPSAAAAFPAQQADPFAGPSLFDRSPERAVTLGGFEVAADVAVPLVSVNDFDRAPFLATPEELGAIGTTARELVANPLRLRLPATIALNHRVVLAIAGFPVDVGDELLAFKWGRRIGRHGRVVDPVARMTVLAVTGDSAWARVHRIFGDYEVGDPVIHLQPYPEQPPVALVGIDAGVTGTVLAFAARQPLLGLGQVVFLDIGTTQGIGIGDEFAAFAPAVSDPSSTSVTDAQAVLRVVQARAGTSTAVVVGMRDVGTAEGSPIRLVGEASPSAP